MASYRLSSVRWRFADHAAVVASSFECWIRRFAVPELAFFVILMFINVYHYLLDAMMWRKGDPDVAQHLFGINVGVVSRSCI